MADFLGSNAAAAPLVMAGASSESEILKRNTDCVHFLASPLTCKKVQLAAAAACVDVSPMVSR